VKIDRGANDSVEKGQLFDIFKGKDLLVRAKVTQVRDEEAILTVLDYQQDQWIESGMIARRLLKTQERP
jgi:cell shape-determining protein MreC